MQASIDGKKDTLTVGTLTGDQRFLLTKSSDHISFMTVRDRSRSNPQVPNLVITPVGERESKQLISASLLKTDDKQKQITRCKSSTGLSISYIVSNIKEQIEHIKDLKLEYVKSNVEKYYNKIELLTNEISKRKELNAQSILKRQEKHLLLEDLEKIILTYEELKSGLEDTSEKYIAYTKKETQDAFKYKEIEQEITQLLETELRYQEDNVKFKREILRIKSKIENKEEKATIEASEIYDPQIESCEKLISKYQKEFI